MIKSKNKRYLYILALLVSLTHNAKATFLDSDPYCTNYGCAVICDNNICNVYDAYIIATGGVVAPGNQLIFYTTNPVLGTGTSAFQANYRNTFTKTDVAPANSGSRISVVNPSSGGVVTDAGSAGFLDAGDNITAFGLGATTNLSWVGTGDDPAGATTGTNPLRHTFYFCSRGISVNIRAQIAQNNSSGDYSTNVPLSNIGFNISANRTGTDAGITYGNTSRNPVAFTSAGLTNLANFNTLTTVGWFTNSTRVNNTGGANNVNNQMRQCNRINLDYTFPNFGLHLGSGIVNYEIDYSFWRR